MCYIISVSKTDNYVPLFFCIKKKKKKKKKQNMETSKHGNMENIKSYATIPTLHYSGKGGKPHGKKSQSISQNKTRLWPYTFFDPYLLKLHVKIPNFFFDLNSQ